MYDTKENILITSLRLFAKEGYEAVSVSKIAAELNITKGALYKHYKNKRDIFNSIIERMYQMDYENAKKFEVPEEKFDKSPVSYKNTTMDKINLYSKAQFKYWTENEFASNFRKMLTLEQYKNTEMSKLYQDYLSSGPIEYIENLFREMMEKGTLKKNDPNKLAVEYYAPFYLLLNIFDISPDKNKVFDLLSAHIKQFTERNSTK